MSYNMLNHETYIISEAKKEEQERIIGILRQDLCDNPDCAQTYEHATCQMVADLIRRIQGKEVEL